MTRPQRRAGAATALLVVAALAGATLGSATGAVVGAAPAMAAWRAEAVSAQQPVTMATWGARIDPRGAAGTGSNPYSASGLLVAGAGGVDLVNTSSVPARITATVTSSSLLSTATVTVTSCTVPWTGTTCSSGAKDLVTVQTGSLGVPASGSWTVDLELEAKQYLKFSAGGLAPSISFGATATPQRTTGLDRTAS